MDKINIEKTILENLVKSAIFDPEKEVRTTSIKMLKERYTGKLISGYVDKNQIFIKILDDGKVKRGYLGEMPASYLGEKAHAHNFRISGFFDFFGKLF